MRMRERLRRWLETWKLYECYVSGPYGVHLLYEGYYPCMLLYAFEIERLRARGYSVEKRDK